MIIWPVELPDEPLLQAYNEQLPKMIVRTPMDQGPAKTRRLSSTNSRFVNVEFIFTEAELEIFDEFFMTTILGGALSFTWVHPRTLAIVDCRIMVDSSQGPSYQKSSNDLFSVEFVLEILP